MPEDYGEAAKWFRKAANQGNTDGHIGLGGMYWRGQGVPQDYAEAAKWYRKGAERGDVWRAIRGGRNRPTRLLAAMRLENAKASESGKTRFFQCPADLSPKPRRCERAQQAALTLAIGMN